MTAGVVRAAPQGPSGSHVTQHVPERRCGPDTEALSPTEVLGRGHGAYPVLCAGPPKKPTMQWAPEGPAERNLAPVVQRTVEVFGDPVATVRDLGGGMAAAVAPLRKRGIADLVCHQHFLKAVGTKLMETAYDRLRALLKGIGLRAALVELRRELRPFVGDAAPGAQSARDRVRKELPALVHWLLQGEGKKELPFPFALHHLDRFLRCRAFPELVEQWLPRPWSAAERKSVGRLESLVC